MLFAWADVPRGEPLPNPEANAVTEREWQELRERAVAVMEAALERAQGPACRRCHTTSLVDLDVATMERHGECASCSAWGAAVVSEPYKAGPFAEWAARMQERWLVTRAGMFVEGRR